MSSIWSDPLNTRLYNTYSQNYPLYREAGRYLVNMAPIQAGMTVLDLACGTGVVTELLQEKLAGTGQLIGADLSATMLEAARQRPALQGVRFYQSPAEELAKVLGAYMVDVVVCNSAFWHMRTDETLAALATILKPGGAFLFNRPKYGQRRPESFVYKLLSGMFEIARNEYGYTRPPSTGPVTPTMRSMSFEQVQQTIEKAGFYLVRREDAGIERTAADIYTFEQIPVMTIRYLPGLNYKTRMEILARAYQRLDPSETDIAWWEHYHLKV